MSQILVPRYAAKPKLGMTSPNEQAYFEWYGRHLYTGHSAIVDLGCWLGSTTIPLAAGLRANPKRGSRRIHAYDQFTWEPWMETTSAGSALRPCPVEGASFLAAFEERVAPWSDLVVAHPVDLATEEWDGGSIEFLLVDAMKSWELSDAIVRNFFPSLMVGGYVLHQDFSHYFTPWVHLVSYRLREYLHPVYDVPRSASTIFQVTKQLPTDLAKITTSSQTDFSVQEVDDAFAWSMSFVGADKRPAIIAAKSKYLLERIGPEAALALVEPWHAQHPGHVDLGRALAMIEDEAAAR